MTADADSVSFRGDEDALELDGGGGCTHGVCTKCQ